MSDIIYTGTVTVKYHVRHRPDRGRYSYDWITDSGDESDCFYQSSEEAVFDVETRYSDAT